MKQYDGILRKPFLSEHWHKGFAAGLAIWLPAFLPAFSLFIGRLEKALPLAAMVASAVSITIVAAVITHHEGFTLEPGQQRYRAYTWVLGLHFGKWQRLPAISHVLVRPYQQRHALAMTSASGPTTLGLVATERNYQVLLSIVGSPIGIIAAYATHEKAILIANTLADLIEVEVLN